MQLTYLTQNPKPNQKVPKLVDLKLRLSSGLTVLKIRSASAKEGTVPPSLVKVESMYSM